MWWRSTDLECHHVDFDFYYPISVIFKIFFNIYFRFVASALQLAKTLEVPLVNDVGYTKRYVRCLQVLQCKFIIENRYVSSSIV